MTDLSILGSKGESKQHTPVESPDSLINISYANILDGISEGPIVGLVNGAQSIYLDKTPLANSDGSLNFTGVTWEQRTGEHDQDHISGFPAVESQSSVGIELKASQPWVQAFSNLELSAVRVQLSAGALVVTEKDGDRVGYRVAYEIDLSTDGSDYKVVHSGAFDGKTTTGYQRSIRIDLPKATRGWRLRVRRTTPDSTTSNTQATTSVGTYTEIIDAKLQYPYTALCGLKIDASQFSSIPERAYRIRGRIIQVPSNYTPATRAYAGTWDGTFKLAWTDCPAWIWRDIVLNDRYGLGRFIDSSQLDKWALYQIARYCDEMVSDGKGGREPRFTCNVYLQSRADALTVLQDLASVFRGMSYYASSQVACAADMPGDPVYTYTNANVIDGKFSRAGSSGSTRFSVAKVAWSDRENFGNQRVEYVQDQKSLARYGVRETEITAFGCVSQGQAQRAGQYILLTNRLETGTITFSVGLDGTICRPGDVIRVADEHYAGAPLAGRIKAATASTVTLDDDVKVAAGDTLVVILPKGVAETRVVRSVAGRVVTVTQAFSAVPVKESVYTIETSTLVAETYRVLTVNENFGDDKLQYDVVAIARNNSKFAAIDDGAQIIIPPTSVLPAAVQAPPTNVKLSTFDTLNQGINIATMRITWDAPRGAQSYRVWWKRNSGDWIYAGVTYTAALEVRGIYSGTYTARVSAEGVAGNSSVWALSEPTALFGKMGEPPALASLKAESLLFGIGLTWAFPPGAEDTQRTELWYSQGTDLAKATKLADLAYPQDKHTLQGLRAGQRFYFWARLVDKSGNVGPWFPSGTTLVTGVSSADAGPILEQIQGQVTESAIGQKLNERIDLVDGTGPGSVNERVTTASNAIKADVNKQLIQVNSTIDGVRSNLQGQITAVDGRVTTARDDLQKQIGEVSSIAGALPYNKTKTYALDQAVLGTNGKLYQAKKAVPVNVAPPNADYWEDVGQSVRTANGTASAVSKLQMDVTTLGDTVTATSGKVDGFQASINTANSNASAAQGAAQAANDLAGGKGKVIVQSAAPAAADRLPQNLWIDTTSSANTPKRWNGSAWVSVSDKVATDAAAAAQSALNQVGSKADASAVNSLKLTVEQQGRDLTSQGSTLNGLQTTVDGKASSQALTQLSNRVKLTEDKNGLQDDTLKSQSESLTTLKDTVAKKADVSTVNQLANDVKTQGDTVSAQGSSLTKIEASLPSISGENLLPNSSFEDAIADGSRPRHWAVSGAAARAFVPSPLTSSINAFRISASIGAGSYIEVVSQPSDGRARVKVTAGATYTLSVYARGSGAPGFLRMYLQFLDAAGAVLSAPSTSNKPVLGESFTRYTLTGTAPANATQVNVYACRLFNDSNAAATLWAEIDNVQLQEGLVATAYQPSIVATADASAEAVTSLGARVEKNEQGLKSSGEQVTRLTNSLTITDGNVDKAQKAAQDAYGLADGKGKVIVQNATPAAADRQPQNLWIDTTGGANTPKRWNGSAWAAVTDKVATDAAAAAQNALNQLGGKADASALSTLGSTVEQQGRDITAAGQSITRIDASIASAGSENLLFNPSFDVASDANANIAAGWYWRYTAGVVVTPTLRNSDLGAEGKCQRLDVSGLTAGSGASYVDFVPLGERQPPVFGGVQYTASVYARGNTGLLLQVYMQFKDAAGNTLSTNGPSNLALNPTYQRPLLVSALAPNGSVRVDVLYRIRSNAGSSLTAGFVDFDMAQLEQGNTLTGWRDNGKANADSIAANAAATTALTGRVEKTEQGLTSTSGSITQLENSIGDIGGENLLFNPTFNKYASLNGWAEGWETEGSVTSVDTLVPSWMNSGEKAQRVVASGLNTSSAYKSVRTSGPKRIAVAGGQAVTASAYVRRGSDPVGMRIFIQWMNASDTVISAPASTMFPLSVTGDRVQFSAVAPADAVKAYIYYRAYGPTTSATPATFEVARPQAEYGTKATGWRDNGQVAATQQAATSMAVDKLVSTVDQQGRDLTSYSSRTTTLENNLTTTDGNVGKAQKAAQDAYGLADGKGKVLVQSWAPAVVNQQAQNLWIDTTGGANTPKRWTGTAWQAVTDKVALDAAAAAQNALNQLGSKADAKAVTDLTTRVKDTEDGLSSQAGQLTQLSSSIGSAQPFVAGYSWEMTGSNRGWGANTSSATMAPGPLFSTVSGYTNIQATSNFGKISGTENPYLRIRLRRRNTGRASPAMYWANEDGGLAESRRFNWKIDLTTTDWQDIELDLSGHAGWNGKTGIYAIRLDMMNSNDSNPQVDIAYIAVGRRSAAASAQAFSLMETTVTQQGKDLTLTAGDVTTLKGEIGKTNGNVTEEARLRVEGDKAQATKTDRVQTNLDTTNGTVKTVSDAVVKLDGKVNTSFSVRLQASAGGTHYAAGFGIGLDNNAGTFQSSFVVKADRFVVMNPVGEGLITPFAIQNGQVFINDALISNLAVQRAVVGSTIGSQALTSYGAPRMTLNFNGGEMIIQNNARSGRYIHMREDGIFLVADGVIVVEMSMN